MVCGHNAAHTELENRLADFVNRKKALLFSSGYMANLAMVNTFLNHKDAIFIDRLNHASIVDAAILSRAKLKRYSHCDSHALRVALDQSKAEHKLVITDGVFSMDGDVAPLPDLLPVCRAANAWTGVDDAHGFGVLGASGAGVLEHFKLSENDVPLLMATLGKAVGCSGAFIAADEQVIEMILQSARSYIYTTALPPALAMAGIKALSIMQSETWRREKLFALIRRFVNGAKQLALPVSESCTPIQPVIIGSNNKALQTSRTLMQQGILVTAIRPPTVPRGTARLRITLSAEHTDDQVDRLLEALERCAVHANK